MRNLLKLTGAYGQVEISDTQVQSKGFNQLNTDNLLSLVAKALSFSPISKVSKLRFYDGVSVLGDGTILSTSYTDTSVTFNATSGANLFTGTYTKIELLDNLHNTIASYTPVTPLTKSAGVAVNVIWVITLKA